MVQEIDVGEPLANARREIFASLLAQGLSQTEAFKQAGYGPNAAPKTANINACRLASVPEIRSRVAQLRQAASNGRLLTMQRRREILARIGDWKSSTEPDPGFALAPSYSERVAAIREDAILAGERRTDGTQVTFAQINVGTMLAALSAPEASTPLGGQEPKLAEKVAESPTCVPENGPLG